MSALSFDRGFRSSGCCVDDFVSATGEIAKQVEDVLTEFVGLMMEETTANLMKKFEATIDKLRALDAGATDAITSRMIDVLSLASFLSKKFGETTEHGLMKMLKWCSVFHEEGIASYMQIFDVLRQSHIEMQKRRLYSYDDAMRTIEGKRRELFPTSQKADSLKELEAVKKSLNELEGRLRSKMEELMSLQEMLDSQDKKFLEYSTIIRSESFKSRGCKGSSGKKSHKLKIAVNKEERRELNISHANLQKKRDEIEAEIALLKRDITTRRLLISRLKSEEGDG